MRTNPVAVTIFLLAAAAPVAQGRQWSDTSGAYTVEADLIAFDDQKVILQRADKQLASFEIAQLSQGDRDYLATKEARLAAEALANKRQTWTTRGGLQVVGNVVDYVTKQVTLQRRRGHVYVNDRRFDNLPGVYQSIVPQLVAHFEGNRVSDKRTLEAWLTRRRGGPVTYKAEGVVLELDNGDEYAVPFFLFSDKDQSLLKSGWNDWLAMQEDYSKKESMAGELRALAAARQQDAQVTQQIAKLQLLTTTVAAGVTGLWEVTLFPGPGVAGPPLWVVAPGRDSLTATNFALSNNPGYVAGSVRRLNRR
jgi:hypothetical protein